MLLLPNVFEPKLCQHLISLYDQGSGEDSGFMREEEGLTVRALNHIHKQRRDTEISDERLISLLKQRVIRRIVPEIQKVFQFRVTRMERYIVACHSEEHGGHFRPHRDNTTKGTVHRRFALSVNLNDDYDGAAAKIREENSRFLSQGNEAYSSTTSGPTQT